MSIKRFLKGRFKMFERVDEALETLEIESESGAAMKDERGHETEIRDDGKEYFCDTGKLWAWEKGALGPHPPRRPCGHCGLHDTPEGHDGCLGTLPDPDIMNACCGHGTRDWAYVQFWNSPRLGGEDAAAYIEEALGAPLPEKEASSD